MASGVFLKFKFQNDRLTNAGTAGSGNFPSPIEMARRYMLYTQQLVANAQPGITVLKFAPQVM